jgi:EAL domain-containing protein (putative c-di-GMP-specific phosphodiesterase class I)
MTIGVQAPKRVKRAALFSEIVDYLNQREFPRIKGSQKLDDTIYIEGDHIRAHYASFQLDTLFQPIFDYSKQCVVGHEAFLSSTSPTQSFMLDNVLEPERIFTLASNEDITFLDRLARTIHTLNYLVQDPDELLHLNVHPQHLLAVSADHGRVFGGILYRCGLEPQHIVLEIAEYAISDKRALQEAISSWQDKDYHIAIDGFGRDHTQLNRVLKLKPDYLKLDKKFLLSALDDTRRFRQLARIVETARDANVNVIGDGIENSQHLDLLQKLDIPLGQGNLFARAQPYCLHSNRLPSGR